MVRAMILGLDCMDLNPAVPLTTGVNLVKVT